MATREEALRWKKNLRQELEKLCDDYTYDFLILLGKEPPITERVIEKFWDALAQAYARTSRAINKMYGEAELEEIELNSLIWDKNPVVLDGRIEKHLETHQKRLGTTKEKYKYLMLLNRLLTNEVFTVSSNLIYQKIKAIFKYKVIYAELIPGDSCDTCSELVGIPEPLSIITDLPPFHPYCDCEYIYYHVTVEKETELLV